MGKMFKFELVADKKDRTLGVAFRIFGIDFAFLLLGYLNDWMLIDFRFPIRWFGIYFQVLFALVAVGRFGEDGLYRRGE